MYVVVSWYEVMYFGENDQPANRPPKGGGYTLSSYRKSAPTPPPTAPLQQQRKIQTAKPKHKLLVLWSGTALLVALLVVGGWVFVINRKSGPLPADVAQNAGFAVYYPSPMIPGYAVKFGSVKLDQGSVFYTLQNGSNVITVSEQSVPANPPDLNHLNGFTTFSTLAGNAAIGKTLGRSVALLLTNTTLVTIQGSPSTPQATVGNIARAMNPLQQ